MNKKRNETLQSAILFYNAIIGRCAINGGSVLKRVAKSLFFWSNSPFHTRFLGLRSMVDRALGDVFQNR
jgi:hypothetical protein